MSVPPAEPGPGSEAPVRGGCAALWRRARDPGEAPARRAFAAAELVCLPLSLMTLLALPALWALRRFTGLQPPACVDAFVVPVLCSGAVGYLTNFVAVRMLFEPHAPSRRHWLTIGTLGLWRRGLVPANRERLARSVARQVAGELLCPAALSRELTGMVAQALGDPATHERARQALAALLETHRHEILAAIAPRLEAALAVEVARLSSPGTLRRLWDELAVAWLHEERHRTVAAHRIVALLQRRAPRFIELARAALHDMLARSPLIRRVPFIDLPGLIVAAVDWDGLEASLRVRLDAPETHAAVKDELACAAEDVRRWLAAEDAQPEVDRLAAFLRSRLERLLDDSLRTALPALIDTLLRSEEVWHWVRERVLPVAQARLERWLAHDGQARVVATLDVENRIAAAIRTKDMRDVQRMIDAVAAEHLGAIQVLGYLLGLLVGLLLVGQQARAGQ